jgi:methionyl-tRNA synthetase
MKIYFSGERGISMNAIFTTIQSNPVLLYSVIIWSIIWKAIALWHAARNNQLAWYIILVVVNTVGILEIIYLLFFRKRK